MCSTYVEEWFRDSKKPRPHRGVRLTTGAIEARHASFGSRSQREQKFAKLSQ